MKLRQYLETVLWQFPGRRYAFIACPCRICGRRLERGKDRRLALVVEGESGFYPLHRPGRRWTLPWRKLRHAKATAEETARALNEARGVGRRQVIEIVRTSWLADDAESLLRSVGLDPDGRQEGR